MNGIVVIALLTRIFSNPCANVLQKKLTAGGTSSSAVNLFTFLTLSICCIPFALRENWSALPNEIWTACLIMGVLGALGNAALVEAIKGGEISVLGPLNSYKPIMGVFLAFFILSEIPSALALLGILMIALGSVYVMKKTGEKFSFKLFFERSVLLRFAAMFLTAAEAVFIKRVIEYSSAQTAFILWCFFCAAFSIPILFFLKKDLSIKLKNKTAAAMLLGIVACVGAMQLSTNFVFKYMDVGGALALFQLSALVSVVFGCKIFHEKNPWNKLAGAAIMAIGASLIIMN